jgi:hypothetical protein
MRKGASTDYTDSQRNLSTSRGLARKIFCSVQNTWNVVDMLLHNNRHDGVSYTRDSVVQDRNDREKFTESIFSG